MPIDDAVRSPEDIVAEPVVNSLCIRYALFVESLVSVMYKFCTLKSALAFPNLIRKFADELIISLG
jgi:hypothetical protein